MEHRWGRRIAVDIPVKVVAPGVSLMRPAQLADLSVTGALIKAEFTLRVRSRIQIVVEATPTVTELLRAVTLPIAAATRHHGDPVGLSPPKAPFFGSSPSIPAAGRSASLDERSTKNIATWSSYLATDCIAAMVSRGWDRTT
jgi:hypothetical protein